MIYRVQKLLNTENCPSSVVITDAEYTEMLNLNPNDWSESLILSAISAIKYLATIDKTRNAKKVYDKYYIYRIINDDASLKAFLTAFRGYLFVIDKEDDEQSEKDTRLQKLYIKWYQLFLAKGASSLYTSSLFEYFVQKLGMKSNFEVNINSLSLDTLDVLTVEESKDIIEIYNNIVNSKRPSESITISDDTE